MCFILAKVHLRLTAPDDFSTDEHRKIVKESRALVADRLPELKTTVTTGWTEWRVPRAGNGYWHFIPARLPQISMRLMHWSQTSERRAAHRGNSVSSGTPHNFG
jgi:hypothetical protein